MGRSSVSSWLIDRAVHAILIVILLVNAGFMVSCALDDGADLDGEKVSETRQAVVVATTSDVGTLPGNFSVSPRGIGSYVVPLFTPPGRSGMSPQLSVSYSSSGAGDGHVGVGWSVSGGMSMIHRCVKNSRRHTRPQTISFINSVAEQYCLDGQPLVLVNGINGTVGAEYRTEPESFAKIVIDAVKDAQPAGFTVFERDGRIQTYGTSTTQGGFEDDTLLVRGNRDQWELTATPNRNDANVVNNPLGTAIYGWLRGSIRDRFAVPNFIWFRYSHPSDRASPGAAQEPLLDTIEYVDVAGFRTRQIKFTYGPLPSVDSERREFIANREDLNAERRQQKSLHESGIQVVASGLAGSRARVEWKGC
jgi:hypothetical protein